MKYLLILLLLISSCTYKREYEKPFIITYKNIDNWHYNGDAEYRFESKNGNDKWFRDSCNKYNIGDTIK